MWSFHGTGGRLDGAVISYCDDDDYGNVVAIGQRRSEPAVVDIDDHLLTSYHLSGLVAGQTYRVTVCARTRVGCGQPFTVDLHTPPAGRTSLTLTFHTF